MSDKELIEYLYKKLEDALSDPDFFDISKEELATLKEELDKRGVYNMLNAWL